MEKNTDDDNLHYITNLIKMIGRITKCIINNITIIQDNVGNEWRHINSEDNPADAKSRGQLPHAFHQNRTWFKGLLWLG